MNYQDIVDLVREKQDGEVVTIYGNKAQGSDYFIVKYKTKYSGDQPHWCVITPGPTPVFQYRGELGPDYYKLVGAMTMMRQEPEFNVGDVLSSLHSDTKVIVTNVEKKVVEGIRIIKKGSLKPSIVTYWRDNMKDQFKNLGQVKL